MKYINLRIGITEKIVETVRKKGLDMSMINKSTEQAVQLAIDQFENMAEENNFVVTGWTKK
ncbi:MAG: hypothetical protein KJI69_04985 [Patescibacteria group bacterium]|nr:hypothetical protein [Patescibacteria group bacterium]